MNETLTQFLGGLDPEVKSLVDVKSVETVYDLLFEGVEFEENEYVEITYDGFKKAKHIQTFGDFIETAGRLSGNSNLAVSPCIKKIVKENKNKRTGKEEAYRQKCIILDIDNPNNHSLLREEDARKWYASWEQVWRKPKNKNTP